MPTCRILIADDDVGILEILEERIKAYELFQDPPEISCALNGEEALTYLNSKDYQLLITDYSMPIINGLELIERVRLGDSSHKEIPVILISGMLPALELLAPNVSTNVYSFSKPFQTCDFQNKIKDLLCL